MEALSLLAGFFAAFATYFSAKAFSFSKETWSGLLWVAILLFSLGVGVFLASLQPLFGVIGFIVGLLLSFLLGRGSRTDFQVTVKDKIKKEEG